MIRDKKITNLPNDNTKLDLKPFTNQNKMKLKEQDLKY